MGQEPADSFEGLTRIAIAVVEHNDQFLVGRRPEGVPLGGHWEFPGGKVEANESPGTAAVRECREETGVEVTVVGFYPPQVQSYDHGCLELQFLACRPRGPCGSPVPSEPWRWVPRSELGGLNFPAGNRRLLALLLSPLRAGRDQESMRLNKASG